MESQITQLAGSINNLEANQGRLPSQAEKNPRENVSAIILHPGKTGLKQHRIESAHPCNSTVSCLQIKSEPVESWLKQEPKINQVNKQREGETIELSHPSHPNAKASDFRQELPQKCEDPGMYTIPISIGKFNVNKAMLDLGATINVMPLSIFKKLDLGPMKNTSIILELE